MEKDLKVILKSSFFGQTEMEYWGFQVTPDGVKPIDKNTINLKILSH